jgi:hypothetical protein
VNDPVSHPADKALNDKLNEAHRLLVEIAESDRLRSQADRTKVKSLVLAIDAVHHHWMERKLRGR